MQLVNVKVQYIRPKFNNLRDWCNDENNIYIGRKGVVFITNNDGSKTRYPLNNSILHNPFKITNSSDRNTVCDLYYNYINDKLDNEQDNGPFHTTIKNLANKNIGCWCFPNRCHGNELIKIYNERINSDK